ncbi:MAG: M23 family metallopeptidase [Gemmatimonadales bacterium]|nr:MAG: M23 family metallopeptidase [Gemmatimonadales bacterium]
MTRSPQRSRRPLLALVATLALGFLVLRPLLADPVPDGGELEVMKAASAEDIRVEVLDRGQTFGGILSRANLSPSEQHSLLLAFREQANPARMRDGTEIVLRWIRGDEGLRGVDVALNPDELVRLERDEFGWRSSIVETPVWADTVMVAGLIERDLWSAVVLNPELREMPMGDRARVIDLMDRVFQWQLDFSRQIQSGDAYRLVFERMVRPDGSMRSGRILAAELVNRDTPLHAIWFDLHEDGEGGYYDLDGESLRRAFIRAPLEYRRISSVFTRNRLHPVYGVNRPHNGVDYAAPTGTPIMATADGVVTRREWVGGYGNLIDIRHANGFLTRYAHLNSFDSSIRVGGRVRQGQIIGTVGMTGTATGPHLHYEMHRNGQAVDPLNVDIPAGDPIPEDARDRWEGMRGTRFAMLETLPSAPDMRLAAARAAERTATVDDD